MESDLRSRMVSVEHTVQGNSQRLTALEAWQRQSEIADARKDEQWRHLDSRFSTLNGKIDDVETTLGKKIDGVSGTLSWMGKLIIGGIVAGIIAFMIKGGFAS